MIRDSIARHGGASAPDVPRPPASFAPDPAPAHASFVRLQLARPAGEDWCLIEPAVRCNHCGYCLSYGH